MEWLQARSSADIAEAERGWGRYRAYDWPPWSMAVACGVSPGEKRRNRGTTWLGKGEERGPRLRDGGRSSPGLAMGRNLEQLRAAAGAPPMEFIH